MLRQACRDLVRAKAGSDASRLAGRTRAGGISWPNSRRVPAWPWPSTTPSAGKWGRTGSGRPTWPPGPSCTTPAWRSGGTLEFHPHRDGDGWAQGAYGIPEPPRLPGRPPRTDGFDLVLVPGVAFDRMGRRLGQGLGYYDRFLGRLPGDVLRVGLAYSDQVVPEVPVDEWDVTLHALVTEEGVIRFPQGVRDPEKIDGSPRRQTLNTLIAVIAVLAALVVALGVYVVSLVSKRKDRRRQGAGRGGEGGGDPPERPEGGGERPEGGRPPGQGPHAPGEARFRAGDAGPEERAEPGGEAAPPEGGPARQEERAPREPERRDREEGAGDRGAGAQGRGEPGRARVADRPGPGRPPADRRPVGRAGQGRDRGADHERGEARGGEEGPGHRGGIQGRGGAEGPEDDRGRRPAVRGGLRHGARGDRGPAPVRGDEGEDHRPRGAQHPGLRGGHGDRRHHRRHPGGGHPVRVQPGPQGDRPDLPLAAGPGRQDPPGADRGDGREGHQGSRRDDPRGGGAGAVRPGDPRRPRGAGEAGREAEVPHFLRPEHLHPLARGGVPLRHDRRPSWGSTRRSPSGRGCSTTSGRRWTTRWKGPTR